MTDINCELSRGLVTYLGYGTEAYPKEDVNRLIALVGNEASVQLSGEIREILDELNQLKPDWTSHSLQSAGDWVKKMMVTRHPQLDDRALEALAWVFTWWWR
jgi:hypothetical protein